MKILRTMLECEITNKQFGLLTKITQSLSQNTSIFEKHFMTTLWHSETKVTINRWQFIRQINKWGSVVLKVEEQVAGAIAADLNTP